MKNTIFRNNIGYIKGFLQKDGFWYIQNFVVFKKNRGKGFARKLAKHLPKKCKLMAFPSGDCKFSEDGLTCFYRSLGFKRYYESKESKNYIRMKRSHAPE